MRTDVLLLVPLQPATGSLMDPTYRQTLGARQTLPLLAARQELELELGRPLQITDGPRFGAEPIATPAHRSLTAITLATALERAGLSWHVLDPGVRELGWWRKQLAAIADRRPRTVGISTTFLMSRPWAQALCALARRAFPDARLLVGGYYYATDARAFLSLEADVYCVGEGEKRLVDVVERVRHDRALDEVPGLYLRAADGVLRYTGDAEALELGALGAPDWSLAERIEPRIELDRDLLDIPVETQRGCVFKCQYCTYRTLAELSVMSPDTAAERIMDAGRGARGWMNLVDATATYPRDRWNAILDQLIACGGAPLSVGAFARVSDITAKIATKMAAANVRSVFIGQESGDQAMLNAMRKGTRADSVGPAVAALGNAGIDAYFSFLLGFPGETTESIEATRQMIVELNSHAPRRPVCVLYTIQPFSLFDLAAVGNRDGSSHWLGWQHGEVDARRVADEILATLVATSKRPDAPVSADAIGTAKETPGSSAPLLGHPHRAALFRWLKAVERGIAIFVERQLDGTRPDARELRTIKSTITEAYSASEPRPGFVIDRRLRRLTARGLAREWKREQTSGVGPLTRVALAAATGRDSGLRAAVRGLTSSTPSSAGVDERVDVLARELVRKSETRPRRQ